MRRRDRVAFGLPPDCRPVESAHYQVPAHDPFGVPNDHGYNPARPGSGVSDTVDSMADDREADVHSVLDRDDAADAHGLHPVRCLRDGKASGGDQCVAL
jgi:hypothetical protein